MPLTSSGIAYDRTVAAGPPVLFLHAGVADRAMWDPQWVSLAADVALVRLDLRGFGQSTTAPVGVLSHARDVLATMDELGVERAHVVGSSLGAGVAVDVAVLAPDRVLSLLLCPPGGSLLASPADDLREFVVAEEAALAAGDLPAAVEANIRTWVVGRGRDLKDVEPRVVEHVRRAQLRAFHVAEQLGDVEEEEVEPPALDRLGDLTAPTLVLVGRHDLDTTRDAADRVVAGLPQAAAVTWEDVAHLPSLEQPERFTSLLREHLRAVGRPLP